METKVFTDRLQEAAQLLRQGQLVAVPTETVYGLAGNGLDLQAVQNIYEVKGRPAVKPLSLMVVGAEAMERYCSPVPPAAYVLARHFWPGPLTLVMKARDCVPELVRAGGDTVGLRCPDHPMTLELLRLAALPLAAPSANPSGEESPRDAQRVLGYFQGRIAAVVDGGPCGLGHESTLLDLSQTPYRILRQGVLPREEIVGVLTDSLCVIGFTGGSGCGKTTALAEVEAMGGLVLDCDRIYHQLLSEDRDLLFELTEAFPDAVQDGRLNRKVLGEQVFSDAEKLQLLNTISHRYVRSAVEKSLQEYALQGGELAAVDAVELISSGLDSFCCATVGILSDRSLCLSRIMARDGIDREAAERRLSAQKSSDYYEKHCSHILRNDGDLAAFSKQIQIILQEVLHKHE